MSNPLNASVNKVKKTALAIKILMEWCWLSSSLLNLYHFNMCPVTMQFNGFSVSLSWSLQTSTIRQMSRDPERLNSHFFGKEGIIILQNNNTDVSKFWLFHVTLFPWLPETTIQCKSSEPGCVFLPFGVRVLSVQTSWDKPPSYFPGGCYFTQ